MCIHQFSRTKLTFVCLPTREICWQASKQKGHCLLILIQTQGCRAISTPTRCSSSSSAFIPALHTNIFRRSSSYKSDNGAMLDSISCNLHRFSCVLIWGRPCLHACLYIYLLLLYMVLIWWWFRCWRPVRLQAGVLQQGPWGGNGGKTWNMRQADHISNVKIHYNDAVFAFDFTFTVDGKKKTIHVGGDAPQYNEVLTVNAENMRLVFIDQRLQLIIPRILANSLTIFWWFNYIFDCLYRLL